MYWRLEWSIWSDLTFSMSLAPLVPPFDSKSLSNCCQFYRQSSLRWWPRNSFAMQMIAQGAAICHQMQGVFLPASFSATIPASTHEISKPVRNSAVSKASPHAIVSPAKVDRQTLVDALLLQFTIEAACGSFWRHIRSPIITPVSAHLPSRSPHRPMPRGASGNSEPSC